MEFSHTRMRGPGVANSFRQCNTGELRLRIMEMCGIDADNLRIGIDSDLWPTWRTICESRLIREAAAGYTHMHREIRELMRHADADPTRRRSVTHRTADGRYVTTFKSR